MTIVFYVFFKGGWLCEQTRSFSQQGNLKSELRLFCRLGSGGFSWLIGGWQPAGPGSVTTISCWCFTCKSCKGWGWSMKTCRYVSFFCTVWKGKNRKVASNGKTNTQGGTWMQTAETWTESSGSIIDDTDEDNRNHFYPHLPNLNTLPSHLCVFSTCWMWNLSVNSADCLTLLQLLHTQKRICGKCSGIFYSPAQTLTHHSCRASLNPDLKVKPQKLHLYNILPLGVGAQESCQTCCCEPFPASWTDFGREPV